MTSTKVLLALALGAAFSASQTARATRIEPRAHEPEITQATLARLESLDDPASVKVWVYFTDKNVFDVDALEAKLSDVARSLDPHARARRAKGMGPELVDLYDLEVAPAYLEALERYGAALVHESRWLNAVSVRAPLATLRAIGELPFVRKLTLVRGGGSVGPRPSDLVRPGPGAGAFLDPFDYGPSRDQLDEITVIAAHAAGLSGAGVRIAMLDTGYKRDHPAFARVLQEGRLVAQWDFINNDGETQDEPGDPEGQHTHGTVVWSVIAGFDEGELVGVAHGAEYLLAKTEDTSTEIPAEEDNWVAAAEWADQLGADVLSSSLAYIEWYEYPDMNGNTAPTTIAADIAVSRGIVVCNAAGNWGTMDWFYIGAPADADSCIAVGATEPDGSMWADSSHGPTFDGRTKPEVCARGSLTYAAQIPGGHGGPDLYRYFDGTSMACPLVAGAAALVLEAQPGWTPMMVREALMMTADNALSPNNHRGWGRIDTWAALGGTTGVAAVAAPTAASPRLVLAPNPSADAVDVALRGVNGDPSATGADHGWLEVFSPSGRRIRVLDLDSPGGARWDGRDARGRRVPSGVYLIRWNTGTSEISGKVVVDR